MPGGPRVRALPADSDLLSLHRQAPARWPLLLESVAGGNARWDQLFATDGTGLRLDTDGVTCDLQGNALEGDFLDLLDAAWGDAGPTARVDDGLPFHGGWALYLGYELAGQI
jgi:anthranilate synthase component 1